MKSGRFSEERTIGILKQQEAGQKVAELAREHGISEATIYNWRSKYGGLEVSEAHRLRHLEEENRRLKHLVADLSLDKEVLKAVISKNGWSSQLLVHRAQDCNASHPARTADAEQTCRKLPRPSSRRMPERSLVLQPI